MARIIILCVVVVSVRFLGFEGQINIPDGARGITIAAGLKNR